MKAAAASGEDLSTGRAKTLPRRANLGISKAMSAGRIEHAVARIEAAMERIAAARENALAAASQQAAGSTRVVELVNSHEKLREQVAESLRELDDLIGKLEE